MRARARSLNLSISVNTSLGVMGAMPTHRHNYQPSQLPSADYRDIETHTHVHHLEGLTCACATINFICNGCNNVSMFLMGCIFVHGQTQIVILQMTSKQCEIIRISFVFFAVLSVVF